jgi:hypothetical protein
MMNVSKYWNDVILVKLSKRIDKLDVKINKVFDEIEKHPLLMKIDRGLTDVEYKIRHRHPIDNSDLEDLIKDLSLQHTPKLFELIKRKIAYSYKTILYFVR